jgi:uracil-DNA glycosylase
MRTIEHFIAGQDTAGASGRRHNVFDPNTGEVQAQVMMALGATAERALTHQTRGFTEAHTSTTLERDGVPLDLTYHPSAALRVPTIEMRRAIFEELVSGLKCAAQVASAAQDG